MRTGRSLTVCWSLLPGGVCLVRWGGSPCRGDGSPCRGGLPVPGGSPWSGRGVLLARGVLPAGGSAWSGGFSPGPGGSAWSQGGFSLVRGGVCLVPGGVLWRPPVNRITDTCKNITFATTSLRPVKIKPHTNSVISRLCKTFPFHWRIQEGTLGLISFIFLQFSAKILSNNRFHSRIRGWSLGNPGPATALQRLSVEFFMDFIEQ